MYLLPLFTLMHSHHSSTLHSRAFHPLFLNRNPFTQSHLLCFSLTVCARAQSDAHLFHKDGLSESLSVEPLPPNHFVYPPGR